MNISAISHFFPYTFPLDQDIYCVRRVKKIFCSIAISCFGYGAYHCMASSFRKGLPWLAAGVISLLNVNPSLSILLLPKRRKPITNHVEGLVARKEIQLPIAACSHNNFCVEDFYEYLEGGVKKFLSPRLQCEQNEIYLREVQLFNFSKKPVYLLSKLFDPAFEESSQSIYVDASIQIKKEIRLCRIHLPDGFKSFLVGGAYKAEFQ